MRIGPCRLRISLAVGFCCLFIPRARAEGATLVVDQKHPRASDEGPRDAHTPLHTISATAARAEAGDTVTVHAGITPRASRVWRAVSGFPYSARAIAVPANINVAWVRTFIGRWVWC